MRKAAVQSLAIHGFLLGALWYAANISAFAPPPETQVIDLSAYFKEMAQPTAAPQPPTPKQETVVQKKAETVTPAKPIQKQVTTPKPVVNKVYESVTTAAQTEASAPVAAEVVESAPAQPAPVQTAAAAPASAQPVSAPVTAVNFDYSAYQSTLSSRLEKNKNYPMMARRRGMEGTVKMKLVISATGSLVNSEIVASSGHEILDKEALKLVRSVFPIKHNADKQISVVVPVMYKLQS
jgi:protein TonB